jgi:hypothetical protein
MNGGRARGAIVTTLSAVLLALTLFVPAKGTRGEEAVELAGPYEDPLQQNVQFGRHSYYLTPWRAYMDTWPASRFLQCLGIAFNVDPESADALAQVCADAGIGAARIEVGWGSMSWDDPAKLQDHARTRCITTLKALKAHGIRPLLLLNAHHGVPCPLRHFRVKLMEDAAAGAREVTLDTVDQIKPGYTGLCNAGDYVAACPLITKVDAATKKCQLSMPLKKALKAGQLELQTLKFQPFAGAIFDDGQPNPAAQETLDGWMKYVVAMCTVAKEALGTDGQPDAGFDLEVWNEYSFGSNFLDIGRYYSPPLKFKEPVAYSAHGRVAKGVEIILPMTVDFANDPKNKCPGVRVISGFANQRPWESGTGMWPGQAGFSRHYYTGISLKDNSPENPRKANSGPLNALGKPDGTPDKKDWHTVVPGSFFVPVVNVSMPEYWHYSYQTEFMTRDVQPFPGPWQEHHRYSHPGTGRPAEVWMTEFNLDRGPWMEHIAKLAGCKKDDPRLIALSHATGAKSTLRSFVMHSHKGVHTITIFSTNAGDLHLSVLPDAFFKTLKKENGKLTDEARALVGPQLSVLGRVTKLMKTGERIETARPLSVTKLVEHEPRLAFKGDGTPEHPDRFHRDDFACLPYQLAADRFAIGYYVVTRNIVKAWDEKKDPLDPERYDMPEQRFDVTLANVRGEGATVSVYDPMLDKELPAKVLKAEKRALTVQVPTVDYPRFLILKEAAPGPLVLSPRVKKTDGGEEVTYASNVKGSAWVTCAAFPERSRPGADAVRVEVQPGAERRMPLGDVRKDEAARVTIEHDGLIARWPRWDYDVQGVLGWTQAVAATQIAQPPQRKLPALPDGKRPSAYRLADAGIAWRGQPPRREAAIGSGQNAVQVTLELLPLPPDDAARALPPDNALDECAVSVVQLGGTPAWKAAYTMDAAAHPGLKETVQEYYASPLQKGLLVLSFKGTPKAMETARAAMDAIAKSVTLVE